MRSLSIGLRSLRLLAAMILLAFGGGSAAAQLEWLATEYDFGAFPEAGGPRSGEVRFINRGKRPTSINRVRLTCGCTSEAHTEGEIAPGDTAIVRFTYNPIGRPGRFEKSIKVYTGDADDLTTVKMRGTVIGAPQTLEKDYPYVTGPLRYDTRAVDFGKVRFGTSRHQFIVVYNQSHDSIRPVLAGSDRSLDVGISTPVIAPGDLATISLYLNTRDLTEMGPMEFSLSITADAAAGDSVAIIPIKAEIHPDTGHLTAQQIEHGPRTEVTPRLIDLGSVDLKLVKHPDVYPLSFMISNEGESLLNVTRIFARGLPMRVKRYPATLKPGKNGRVEATVDLRKIPAGPFNFKIEVMSDDPIHPVVTLTLCGEMEKQN